MEQTVATFYQFAHLPDCLDWQKKLRTKCKKLKVLGTVILAEEGINATISGSAESIDEVLEFIKSDDRFTDMPYRLSITPRQTFYRIRVTVRDEIVTLGDSSVNPNEQVGHYIEPENWNQIISDPDITVIDTRNDYEVEIGSFKNSIDPKTQTFGQWDEYVEKNLQDQKDKKIAMFCTGGIRCEKASSHLLKKGFKEVYHLKGGILNYLEKIDPKESLWDGECFVFDHRVSVIHGLKDGRLKLFWLSLAIASGGHGIRQIRTRYLLPALFRFPGPGKKSQFGGKKSTDPICPQEKTRTSWSGCCTYDQSENR